MGPSGWLDGILGGRSSKITQILRTNFAYMIGKSKVAFVRQKYPSKTKQSETKRFEQGGLVAGSAQAATFDAF